MENCPVCNANEFSALIKFSDNYCFGVCRKCGLNYMTPMPSDSQLKEIYKSFSQSYPISDLVADDGDFSAFAKDRYCYVAKKNDTTLPLKLLEVGSSYGLFLKQFRDTPWELHGVEPSEGPASYSRRRHLGIHSIQNCMLNEANLEPDSFDIICSFHVIEHLPDPLETLKTMRRLIKQEGRLYIATPNLALLRPNIIQYNFLHHRLHLVLFTPTTLSAALRRAGFKMTGYCQEKDRPAESGSMILEAKPDKVLDEYFPEEFHHAERYGNELIRMREKLFTVFQEWMHAKRNVAVYGGGVHTQGLLDCIGNLKTCIKLIFDDNPLKQGSLLADIPVRSFSHENLQEIDLIVVSSVSAEDRIIWKVNNLQGNKIQCFGIYRDILNTKRS